MTKLLQCRYPQSPLALPHPLSCVCICVSVVLNSQLHALLPPPLFSLFSLSSLSLLSLLLVCCIRVHICICGPLIPSPLPPLPLFPLVCRVCIRIHGGMLSSLPSLAPLLAYTTASLSPAPCSHSRLAPLRSPHRALFAFMTPLVIVFTFMTRPLPFAFTTVPVFTCCAGPRRPRLCLCRGLLVRYVIGTPAGMPSLMALLSSSLSPCAGPRHPCPCQVSMTRCVYGPSHSCLGSFVFVFTVPRICVCGLAFVALHLWPRVCGFVFVASHLWPRVCGLVFVASCLWLCVCVRICGLAFVFAFVVPCICVCVHSPSCLHSQPAPCIHCVHNCPLTCSHLCRVHLDRL
jgi:hypothetical protein